MATYNGARYIRQQLDSILCQLMPGDELIISDDSSSDGTIGIIESYKDSRIKLLKNNQYRSPIFNIENALKEAKGDYIFLSDQDDIWENNKVRAVLPYLQESHLVVSDAQVIDEQGHILRPSFFSGRSMGANFYKNLKTSPYLGCAMAFRKEVLQWALPFPKKIAMHDLWIGLLTEKLGRVQFISDKLIKHRRHGNNASYSGEKSQNSFFFKVSYRIQLLQNIHKRKQELKKGG